MGPTRIVLDQVGRVPTQLAHSPSVRENCIIINMKGRKYILVEGLFGGRFVCVSFLLNPMDRPPLAFVHGDSDFWK